MSGPELVIETPRVFEPLLEPARYKGAYGGRGSGKSHFFGESVIERSAMEKTDVVCVREKQKSLQQSVKKLLESKIQTMNAGYYFDVQDALIKSIHGGQIIFEGMANHTAESIKSLEGYDVAWVEEAQTLSQKSLDMLRPTIRKPKSELWFSWNSRFKTDPVDALLRGPDAPPNSVVVQANYSDNPWFGETEWLPRWNMTADAIRTSTRISGWAATSRAAMHACSRTGASKNSSGRRARFSASAPTGASRSTQAC